MVGVPLYICIIVDRVQAIVKLAYIVYYIMHCISRVLYIYCYIVKPADVVNQESVVNQSGVVNPVGIVNPVEIVIDG